MDSGTAERSGRGVETEEGGRRWEDMTQEALVDIFARLDFEDKYCNVALVCKTWRRAVQDSTCWVEVDMEPSFVNRRESALWWSSDFEKRMDSMIKTVVDWGSTQLRRLHTRHCSDSALTYLARRCPNLQFLHIQMSQNVTDETISLLAPRCPLLESVDLSECRALSAESMHIIGEHCKGLTLLKRNMLEIDGNCRSRTMVPLRYVQLVPMGDQEATVIAKCMPQLKHLEMCYSTIRDQGLLIIAGTCTQLEFLDLRGCRYLTGRGLDEAKQMFQSFIHFKKPILPERNLQLERYGHWQLYDNRFSHQYLEF